MKSAKITVALAALFLVCGAASAQSNGEKRIINDKKAADKNLEKAQEKYNKTVEQSAKMRAEAAVGTLENSGMFQTGQTYHNKWEKSEFVKDWDEKNVQKAVSDSITAKNNLENAKVAAGNVTAEYLQLMRLKKTFEDAKADTDKLTKEIQWRNNIEDSWQSGFFDKRYETGTTQSGYPITVDKLDGLPTREQNLKDLETARQNLPAAQERLAAAEKEYNDFVNK